MIEPIAPDFTCPNCGVEVYLPSNILPSVCPICGYPEDEAEPTDFDYLTMGEHPEWEEAEPDPEPKPKRKR